MATWQTAYLWPMLFDVLRLIIWMMILAAIFVPLERLFPARRQTVLRKDFLEDSGWFFLNGLVIKSVLFLPMAALAVGLHHIVPGAVQSAAGALPVWLRVVIALILGDVGFYWGHRWAHEVPLLWRFHSVHHSAEQIDWLVNTRAHPVDLIFTRLCGFVPLYAFGLVQTSASGMVTVLGVLAGTIWGFFIHANLRWRFGWLEGLVATPAFHHWHHSKDSHRDSNYAALLPWVDRLFGTYDLPRSLPPHYGIDTPMPHGVGRQLLRPLTGT
nr:sterol desaturase family protein [uncultured Rhodopila sp.]